MSCKVMFKGLFKINPTLPLGLCSASNITLLPKTESTNDDGSDIRSFPLNGSCCFITFLFNFKKNYKKKPLKKRAVFVSNQEKNYFFFLAAAFTGVFTEPSKSAPALNFTTFLAAILIVLPV